MPPSTIPPKHRFIPGNQLPYGITFSYLDIQGNECCLFEILPDDPVRYDQVCAIAALQLAHTKMANKLPRDFSFKNVHTVQAYWGDPPQPQALYTKEQICNQIVQLGIRLSTSKAKSLFSPDEDLNRLIIALCDLYADMGTTKQYRTGKPLTPQKFDSEQSPAIQAPALFNLSF